MAKVFDRAYVWWKSFFLITIILFLTTKSKMGAAEPIGRVVITDSTKLASSYTGTSQSVVRSLPNSPAVRRKRANRRKSNHEPDNSSNASKDSDDIRGVDYHFERRLTRFVRLAGIGQYVSEQTGIARSAVFLPLASQFQDRSSSQVGVHAGHIVRVRLNDALERNFPKIFEPLRDFVGRTHLVPQFANEWHGIGGAIDQIQARFLGEISTINFRGDFNKQAERIIQRLRQAFIDALNDATKNENYTLLQIWDMQGAVAAIAQINMRELFENGREGLGFLIPRP